MRVDDLPLKGAGGNGVHDVASHRGIPETRGCKFTVDGCSQANKRREGLGTAESAREKEGFVERLTCGFDVYADTAIERFLHDAGQVKNVNNGRNISIIYVVSPKLRPALFLALCTRTTKAARHRHQHGSRCAVRRFRVPFHIGDRCTYACYAKNETRAV